MLYILYNNKRNNNKRNKNKSYSHLFMYCSIHVLLDLSAYSFYSTLVECDESQICSQTLPIFYLLFSRHQNNIVSRKFIFIYLLSSRHIKSVILNS